MVDSNDRERITEAKEELGRMLAEDELRSAVLLVFANKQVCMLCSIGGGCHTSHLSSGVVLSQDCSGGTTPKCGCGLARDYKLTIIETRQIFFLYVFNGQKN